MHHPPGMSCHPSRPCRMRDPPWSANLRSRGVGESGSRGVGESGEPEAVLAGEGVHRVVGGTRMEEAGVSDKPNILIIWGDDIGISNLSCYSDGLMGYRTPNIDRVAAEGVRFTDYYGEQSCTAGRAAFILARTHTGWRS